MLTPITGNRFSFIVCLSYKVGTINAPETSDSPNTELHVMYDHVPELLTPSSKTFHTKWVFLTAYGMSKEEVEQSYNEGIQMCLNDS